jgi:hypothetical protein
MSQSSGNKLLVIPRAYFSADRALCATPQEAKLEEKWADARDASLLELLLAMSWKAKVKPSADLFINFAGNVYPAGLCNSF